MNDTRSVYIFDLNQEAWVKAFKQILEAEKDVLEILDRTTYPLNENGEFLFDEKGNIIWLTDETLSVETQEYLNNKLNLIEDTIYYSLILYYRSVGPITFRISGQSTLDYEDVIGINETFVDDNYRVIIDFYNQLTLNNLELEKTLGIHKKSEQTKYDFISRCFIVTDDRQLYYRNVWTFTRPNYPFIGMYGIKRSILDVITNNPLFKGISKLLINKIIQFANENNLIKIIVVNPLPTMVSILIHYGFTEYENEEETPEREFLKPISSTYHYLTYDI